MDVNSFLLLTPISYLFPFATMFITVRILYNLIIIALRGNKTIL